MDADAIIQGGGLILSGAAVAKIGDWLMAWLRSRNQKTAIEPTPLPVDKLDKYVTRGEFNRHVEQNESAHGEVFRRLKDTEQTTARQDGKLDEIGSDVKTIKDLLIGKALKK